MTDRREEILLYLMELLGQIEGITAVYRDRGELPDDKLPAAVLLDGKETLKSSISGHKFNAMPTALFGLYPQIFIILRPRDDVSNETLDGVPAPVGPELSAFRVKVLNAMKDENLALMLGANGQVEYLGFDTDMQTGSTIGAMGAQMQFHFCFYYVLDPSEL